MPPADVAFSTTFKVGYAGIDARYPEYADVAVADFWDWTASPPG